MKIPIPFLGWVDEDDIETMLREQIHAQQSEINALRKALLYVHPIELTDDKITEIAKEIFKDCKNFHHYQIDFARAILKEASGK